MKKIQIPKFKNYEDEAAFWDELDTAPFMEDGGKWFRFDTPTKRAIRVAILPEIAEQLIQQAQAQKVSVETLVNVFLNEHLSKSNVSDLINNR